VAIDGSKFRAVSSERGVREREPLNDIWSAWKKLDARTNWRSTPRRWQQALEKTAQHAEPEARLMRPPAALCPLITCKPQWTPNML